VEKEDIIFENIGNDYPTLESLAKNLGFELTASNIDQIKSVVAKEITEDIVYRRTKQKEIKVDEKYANYDANLGVFLAPEWTLEYTLALSVLAPLLIESIQEIRYKSPYTGKRKDSYDRLIARLKDDTDCKKGIAYDIFKPLNNKIVSKAEVAQLLAIKINKIYNSEKKEEWRKKILEDQYLRYLTNAIKHCSRITEFAGEDANE